MCLIQAEWFTEKIISQINMYVLKCDDSLKRLCHKLMCMPQSTMICYKSHLRCKVFLKNCLVFY
jgi:hypothetical protein